MGVVGLVLAFVVVLVVVDGEYLPAIQGVALTAVSLGLAGASAKYGSNAVRPRAEVDGLGTTVRPDRLLDVSLGIAVLGMGVNVAFAWVWATTSSADWQLAVPTWLVAGARITGVLVGVVICLSLTGFVRRGASTHLRLAPAGVDVGRGVRTRSAGWDQIRDVVYDPPRGRWAIRGSLAVAVSGGDALRIRTEMFTSHGAALRDLVDYYWRHPDARDELVDGRAAERLRDDAAHRAHGGVGRR